MIYLFKWYNRKLKILYKMTENVTSNIEKSFFDDKSSYYYIESSKKSQNDSSNPEKEFSS